MAMRKGPGPSLSNQSILAFGVSTVDFLFNDKEDLRVIGVSENGGGGAKGTKSLRVSRTSVRDLL